MKLEAGMFQTLLEAAPDGMMLVDSKGEIAFANSACTELFGYTTAEMLGQPIEIVVPEYIRSQHAALRQRYFACPHKRPMGLGLDLMAARKDGTTLPVEISLSPLEFEGEACAIAVVRDVTEQRRLTGELKRSNEELEQFAYVASHDLQEPLRMVSGYTQLLARRYGATLSAEGKEYVDFAVDGVKHMQALITDLLAFSRLSSRGFVFAPVDLAEVFGQALANLRTAIEETGAEVSVGPLPTIEGDRTQLVQVAQNLLSNALKFRRPDVPPRITVRARADGRSWRIEVEDNGIGIDPQYSDKVFVIFQRLHTRDRYPGTGIGLSICKKVVERHGGRIWIASPGHGGTAFHLTFPKTEASP